MLKRPAFLPGIASVGCLETGDDEREEDVVLCKYYNGIKEKAQQIPYQQVSYNISKKVAERLTRPTLLEDDRWQIVVSYLGPYDIHFLGKLNRRKNEPGGQFLLFLLEHYSANVQNTLWMLIWALWTSKSTDVLDFIRMDIADFLSKRENGENVHNTNRSAPLSLDSGFADPSLSSIGSHTEVVAPPPINQVTTTTELKTLTHEVAFLQKPNVQDNCLLAPPAAVFLINQDKSKKSRNHKVDNIVCPVDNKPKLYLGDNDDDDDDIADLSFLLFGDNSVKNSKVVSIFILHTMSEEDQRWAEDIKRKLKRIQEIQFEVYLFKDAILCLDMEVGEFVMRVMEYFDFLVPVLTEAYLHEIGIDGNQDNDRLNLRYFHAVSQGRVINKNSLNYLIRPVLCDDVNLSMVRKWHEFRCALKYPKDLSRLAKNLYNTKKLLAKQFYK